MKHFIFLFSLVVILLFVTSQLYADVLFRAFYEGEPPFPNAKVEDPKEWNANVVSPGANVFSEANGKLVQTADDCGHTTKTLLPIINAADWTDYTISFDVWWKDDDGIAIIFRYTDDDNYYSFTIGGTDGHFSNNWVLGPAIFTEAACFGDGGEKGDLIDEGPTGQNVDNTGPFTMMIRVQGTKIEGFFGDPVPPAEILAGKTPTKMMEVTDDTFKRGAIAIGVSTNPAEFANILVTGSGLAVDAKGKLAATWAGIKEQ